MQNNCSCTRGRFNAGSGEHRSLKLRRLCVFPIRLLASTGCPREKFRSLSLSKGPPQSRCFDKLSNQPTPRRAARMRPQTPFLGFWLCQNPKPTIRHGCRIVGTPRRYRLRIRRDADSQALRRPSWCLRLCRKHQAQKRHGCRFWADRPFPAASRTGSAGPGTFHEGIPRGHATRAVHSRPFFVNFWQIP